MKTKTAKTLKSLAMALLLIAFIFGALFLFTGKLTKLLDQEVTSSLGEVSDQSVRIVSNEINSQFSIVQEVAFVLGNGRDGFSVETSMNVLSDTVGRYSFKEMGLSFKDGTTYTTDGVVLDFKDSGFFDTVFEGENMLSGTVTDNTDGEQIMVYSVPVEVDGEIIAVVFASYSSDEFRNLMSVETFNGSGYTYIVEQNGDCVIDSPHPTSFVNMTNIFDSLNGASESNLKVSEKLRQGMLNGESGSVIFINKVDKYLYYTPIGTDGWYLLNVIPKSVLERSVSSIMSITYILCAFIILLLFAFVYYILSSAKKRRESVNQILYVDSLTGGISYTKFTIDVMLKLKNDDRNSAYIVFDLENFNLMNEALGHYEGDKVLKYFHNLLAKYVGQNFMFARRESDKFVGLVYYTDRKDLDKKLIYYCKLVQEKQPKLKGDFKIKPLVGVYLIYDRNEEIQRMQNLATIARDSIVNRHDQYVAYYEDFYRDTLIYNKHLEDQLEIADKNNEFEPYFQPKYDAQTKKIVGAEALIRWIKSDGTVVPPSVFVPLSEKNGFISQLDKKTFRKVCQKQRKLLDEGFEPVPISVNLSRQVMFNISFVEEYAAIVEEYKIPFNLVELEITESALFENQEELSRVVELLREKGFKILMDDFGVGYSSLMMLKSIQIDNLKLDKSFVDDYKNVRGRNILISIIKLAKALDISVTAEGVETEDQYELLKLMNCGTIQGYYFAKPMPFNDYVDKLKAHDVNHKK